MQRISKIKWRDIDEARLRREVKNYNAKINRILKKDPGAVEYLPAKKSITAEREKAKSGTRKEFEFQSKWTRAFTEKGAEKNVKGAAGVNITQYELKYAKELLRRENIKKGLKARESDERIRKGFGDPDKDFARRQRKLNIDVKTPKDFDKFVAALEKRLASSYTQESLDMFKANYMKAVRTIGPYGDGILNLLKDADPLTIFNAVQKDPTLAIKEYYTPEEVALIAAYQEGEWFKILNQAR